MSKVIGENVFITGSKGMLGGSIANLAERSGWSILTPSRSELDLRSRESVLAYMRENRVEAVIHCAAKVGGIAANLAAPADFILENIQVDTSVISSARELGLSKFIYFASSCIYPRVTEQPMKVEQLLTSSLEPTNENYALAKIVGAKSVAAIASQDSLDWRVLIPSNLYGPGDKFDETSGHLVPAVIRKVHDAIFSKNPIVEIWGDGDARREFTFVGDVAHFVVQNFHKTNKWPPMLNIGYGEDYTVNDYYREISNAMGYEGSFVHNAARPIGMRQKLLDSSIARGLGWNPQTNLTLGVRKTVDWYKENIVNV